MYKFLFFVECNLIVINIYFFIIILIIYYEIKKNLLEYDIF